MNPITEINSATIKAPHPLANAKQRAVNSLDETLSRDFEYFLERASVSDKQFVAETLTCWTSAFVGTDLGMASAFESTIRQGLVVLNPYKDFNEAKAPEVLRPDGGRAADVEAQEIDALVEEAMQPVAAEKSTSATFREDTVRRLRSYLEDLLIGGTDGEKHFLLELLITRESCTRGRHGKQLPLAEAFEMEMRGIETEIIRMPRDYYEDWEGYEQWRKADGRQGTVKALLEMMQNHSWFGDVIYRAAGHWMKDGPHGVRPEIMKEVVSEEAEEFEGALADARVMFQRYPEMVKNTNGSKS